VVEIVLYPAIPKSEKLVLILATNKTARDFLSIEAAQ
jgi:hypothetical protein